MASKIKHKQHDSNTHKGENGESFYLHAGESINIKDMEVPHIRHDFHETSDDKSDWDNLMHAISDATHC